MVDKLEVIEAIFQVKRALIGVVHVQALPGTPANKLGIRDIISIGVDEALVYRDAGFHGILIENTHDRPYLKHNVGPEVAEQRPFI